ncbi:MAG: SRPBCC family protein, partial [Balneolaceae bacterium]
WHKFENLPLFMKHLEKVDVLDDKLSEWTAKLPGKAGTLSWTAEMTKEIRNELIEWTSLPDSAIENSGRVQFRDAGKYGTEVKVHIQYQAPLGTPGEGVLSLLNPVFKYLLKEDIRNFKRYMETGEIPTVEGQTSGRLSVDSHQTEKEKSRQPPPSPDKPPAPFCGFYGVSTTFRHSSSLVRNVS